MTATVTSPSGRVLYHQVSKRTTPREDGEAKKIPVKATKDQRVQENKESLKNTNVRAFLKAIGEAEGGEYDFKFGAIKGRKNDPWRFTDFSTHPGPGRGGTTTAAGLYQITKPTWHDHGVNGMGLADFTPETQDLIAVSILRRRGVIEKIKEGDIEAGLAEASRQWAALPKGRGKPGYYHQPYVEFEHFEAVYKSEGGTVK